MAYTMARFKVADYAAWKRSYDEGIAIRRANGSRSSMAFQNVNDPHEVVLLIDWENADVGKAFSQSPEVQALQRRGGVISQPELYAAPERFDA
jgi:heme-degrading monooxygenase HmoA